MSAALRLDPGQGLVRGVRAAVLTAPTVGAAVLAHALGGGCLSFLAVFTAAGVCWPAAVALLGVRRRLPLLLLWIVLAQAVTHLLLERLCADVVSGQASLSQHLLTGLTGPMAVTHAGAVLVTGLLLGRADAGLWAADALLRAGARALRDTQDLPLPALPEPVRSSAPTVADARRPRPVWKAAPPVRRGPPALLAR
ncbi:MAG: hypothetical protein JWN55_1578 [Frankiales bacterium]|nr:hypothetical protein [Frankiales bacterium]